MILNGLEPDRVFYYFEKISQIPRESGKNEKIIEYLRDFSTHRNLEFEADEVGNVIIRKPAATGYEKATGIILQGHLDMVCVSDKDKKKDFSEEGIDLRTDGERIWADKTTLGADDGIAIAYALAILEARNIMHPAIEALFTADEEIGLVGANAFDPFKLKGTRLINLDSEEEGVLTVSCAGGIRAISNFTAKRENYTGKCMQIRIFGLLGGHSGTEINKEQLNANKVLGRVLYSVWKKFGIQLAEIHGGEKENAIPSEAKGIFTVSDGVVQEIKEYICGQLEIMKQSYCMIEPNLCWEVSLAQMDTKVMGKEDTEKILYCLYHMPDGIQRMEHEFAGMVQTSLNAGLIRTGEQEVSIIFSLRSSVTAELEELSRRLDSFISYIGGNTRFYAGYPAWEYRKESLLRQIAMAAYKAVYNDSPKVMPIHAGLECGIFVGKCPELDCISIGPTISYVHTTRECMEVESVNRTWLFLLEILKRSKY